MANPVKGESSAYPGKGWRDVSLESEARNNLGCIQFQRGRYLEALETFRACAESQSSALWECLSKEQTRTGGVNGRTEASGTEREISGGEIPVTPMPFSGSLPIMSMMAITRCNIGCTWLTVKDSDAAIESFQESFEVSYEKHKNLSNNALVDTDSNMFFKLFSFPSYDKKATKKFATNQ